MYIYPKQDWEELDKRHFDILVDLDGNLRKSVVIARLVQAFSRSNHVEANSLDDFDQTFDDWVIRNDGKMQKIGVVFGDWIYQDIITFGHIVSIFGLSAYNLLRFAAWEPKRNGSRRAELDCQSVLEKSDCVTIFLYV